MRIKRIGKVQRLAFRLQIWNVEADTVERQNGIIAGQKIQKGGKNKSGKSIGKKPANMDCNRNIN